MRIFRRSDWEKTAVLINVRRKKNAARFIKIFPKFEYRKNIPRETAEFNGFLAFSLQ
jgi:hypothetical protein